MSGDRSSRWRELWARAGRAAGRLDRDPRLVTSAKFLRELLPGDSAYGDRLSTASSDQIGLLGRRVTALTAERPGFLRETGLSALQVWQALSEAQGRGRSGEPLAIVFTDLVAFSDWALEAGDEAAVELLRDVGEAMEGPVDEHGGRVVKRLGDGMMAVFGEPQAALAALGLARRRLAQVEADGYRPRFRAGIHVGRPRKIGGDYLGVDVNIAARLAEQADADEVLVSQTVLDRIDTDGMRVRRRRRFRVSGVPSDLGAFAVSDGG